MPIPKIALMRPLASRSMHSSPPGNNGKVIEPIFPGQLDQDVFEEMMDDRTNALLKTLGFDIASLRKEGANTEIGKSPNTTGSVLTEKMAPLVAAVDVNAQTTSPKTKQPSSHLFDTQEVYTELRSAGLTPGQAEVVMRTMLELIDELVQTTKKRSVPVAAGANESYLFDAASSEVRNEIQNSRQVQSTAYRSGLARLQRDAEILQHEATEITSLLKSDLDIEVHERKNSARAEENVIQLKIQDLNNKIATRLNSELKSEIENLRWQITRRSLAAIAVVAASIIWITQKNTNTRTAKKQVRQRQTSALKESPTVAVPILSPSVSEEPEYSGHSVLQIDDLVSLTPPSDTESSASQDKSMIKDDAAHAGSVMSADRHRSSGQMDYTREHDTDGSDHGSDHAVRTQASDPFDGTSNDETSQN